MTKIKDLLEMVSQTHGLLECLAGEEKESRWLALDDFFGRRQIEGFEKNKKYIYHSIQKDLGLDLGFCENVFYKKSDGQAYCQKTNTVCYEEEIFPEFCPLINDQVPKEKDK